MWENAESNVSHNPPKWLALDETDWAEDKPDKIVNTCIEVLIGGCFALDVRTADTWWLSGRIGHLQLAQDCGDRLQKSRHETLEDLLIHAAAEDALVLIWHEELRKTNMDGLVIKLPTENIS